MMDLDLWISLVDQTGAVLHFGLLPMPIITTMAHFRARKRTR